MYYSYEQSHYYLVNPIHGSPRSQQEQIFYGSAITLSKNQKIYLRLFSDPTFLAEILTSKRQNRTLQLYIVGT